MNEEDEKCIQNFSPETRKRRRHKRENLAIIGVGWIHLALACSVMNIWVP
jgi:hypothetical protein